MRKLFAAALMCSALGAMADAPPAKYQTTCGVCHSSGAAGAPKTHDQAAWEPRMAKGMNSLVDNVVNGFGGMPPFGLCMDCDVAQFEALINFMATGE